MEREKITFKPIKLETVVVMKGKKVIGTIRRYRQYKGCIVNIPGVLTSAENPGEAFFKTIPEAKSKASGNGRKANDRD